MRGVVRTRRQVREASPKPMHECDDDIEQHLEERGPTSVSLVLNNTLLLHKYNV